MVNKRETLIKDVKMKKTGAMDALCQFDKTHGEAVASFMKVVPQSLVPLWLTPRSSYAQGCKDMEQWHDAYEDNRKAELSAVVAARREAYADSVFSHVHL